jgi:hypothetical protein
MGSEREADDFVEAFLGFNEPCHHEHVADLEPGQCTAELGAIGLAPEAASKTLSQPAAVSC